MLNKLIMIVISSMTLYAGEINSDKIKELQNLTPAQKEVLTKTLKNPSLTKKEKLLFTAIAWKESSLGKYIENPKSGDYGTFQINLNTFNKRFKDDMEYAGLSKFSKRLLKKNYNLNLMAAKAEINFWKRFHKGDLSKTIASYNDGTIISSTGKKYSKDIQDRMRIIEEFKRQERI